MGGALGAAGAGRIVQAIEAAVRMDCPVIGLWHSGGARLADGVESMDGVGTHVRGHDQGVRRRAADLGHPRPRSGGGRVRARAHRRGRHVRRRSRVRDRP
ncbi:hypothetical protein GCM10020219_036550 [Nonomuraea dietziae]